MSEIANYIDQNLELTLRESDFVVVSDLFEHFKQTNPESNYITSKFSRDVRETLLKQHGYKYDLNRKTAKRIKQKTHRVLTGVKLKV